VQAKAVSLRPVVPLLLLGVLSIGALVAAINGGEHQHRYVHGVPVSTTAPATEPTPPFLLKAEETTAKAGSAQFVFSQSLSGAPTAWTIRSFGSVNFAAGTSEIFISDSGVEESVSSLGGPSVTTPVQTTQEMLSTPQGRYNRIVSSGTPGLGSLWARVPVIPFSGAFSPMVQTGLTTPVIAALVRVPAGTTVHRSGSAAVGGVPTTTHAVSEPLATCTISSVGETIKTESGFVISIDAAGRIRRIEQQTFERTARTGSSSSKVLAIDSTLTFSDFGTPVHLTAPTKGQVAHSSSSYASKVVLRSGQDCASGGWVAYAPLSSTSKGAGSG
jgi:hypothetical protein